MSILQIIAIVFGVVAIIGFGGLYIMLRNAVDDMRSE